MPGMLHLLHGKFPLENDETPRGLTFRGRKSRGLNHVCPICCNCNMCHGPMPEAVRACRFKIKIKLVFTHCEIGNRRLYPHTG